MGGFGSGRWASRRPTAENLQRLDLAAIGHRDILSVNSALDVSYQLRGGGHVTARVTFAETVPHFGGRRLWLCCPSCLRRCRVLFAGRRRVACRHCHELRYSSQVETRADRATRAMFKIVRRLDPTAEVNDLPRKPRNMHWKTYERLAERYEMYDTQWTIEVMRRFGIRP